MNDVVRVERDGGVGRIRMNRPERLNACNRGMGEGLLTAASACCLAK